MPVCARTSSSARATAASSATTASPPVSRSALTTTNRVAERDVVEPPPSAREGRATRGLHRDQTRDAPHEPCGSGDREALGERASEGAAPNLHIESIDLDALDGERLGHFEGEGASAFHGEAVVRPLNAERNRAGADLMARGVNAGVAGFVRTAFAHDHGRS